MGSFNVFCAVSSAPIREGQRVVVFGLAPEEEDPVTCWYGATKITSFPLRGVYTGVGGIEWDDDQEERAALLRANTPLLEGAFLEEEGDIHNNNYALMFIHERVYTWLRTRPFEESWGGSPRAQRLDRWEKLVGEGSDLNLDGAGMTIRFTWHDVFIEGGGATGYAHPCWAEMAYADGIETVEDLTALGTAYMDEVKIIHDNARYLGYRIAPSLYCSEDISVLAREPLDAMVQDLRREHRAWMGHDDEEDQP